MCNTLFFNGVSNVKKNSRNSRLSRCVEIHYNLTVDKWRNNAVFHSQNLKGLGISGGRNSRQNSRLGGRNSRLHKSATISAVTQGDNQLKKLGFRRSRLLASRRRRNCKFCSCRPRHS